jgi:hypothetical protein
MLSRHSIMLRKPFVSIVKSRVPKVGLVHTARLMQFNRRYFAKEPKRADPGTPFGERTSPEQPPDATDTSGYISDEDTASFQSDRKFSNFILFTGAIALMGIYMYSNVMSLKRKKENKVQNIGKASYTGKAEDARTSYRL